MLDHNSNGRFDDAVSVRSAERPPRAISCWSIRTRRTKLSADATMGRDRNFVSKTVCIGKDFYRMEVPPAGDRLKLDARQAFPGKRHQSEPRLPRRAVQRRLRGAHVGGTKDQKIPLARGPWKMANYTIDATGFTGGSRTARGGHVRRQRSRRDRDQGRDGQASLRGAVPSGRHRAPDRREQGLLSRWRSSASAASSARISTSTGSRPPQPRFVIKDKDGKIVHQGSFEYG